MMRNLFDLSRKVAVLTGEGRGPGQAAAIRRPRTVAMPPTTKRCDGP